jgi:hypothetical protein
MSLMLLNALLILVGPFLVVAPFAIATAVQMDHWRPARFALRLPSVRLVVSI